ncbi:hypothetical protein KUCAC02_012375, partial [Chaenocephalus aceratus]
DNPDHNALLNTLECTHEEASSNPVGHNAGDYMENIGGCHLRIARLCDKPDTSARGGGATLRSLSLSEQTDDNDHHCCRSGGTQNRTLCDADISLHPEAAALRLSSPFVQDQRSVQQQEALTGCFGICWAHLSDRGKRSERVRAFQLTVFRITLSERLISGDFGPVCVVKTTESHKGENSNHQSGSGDHISRCIPTTLIVILLLSEGKTPEADRRQSNHPPTGCRG